MGEVVSSSVHKKDMELMKELTRVVFSKWYTDVLQENLKVVPDLESGYTHQSQAAQTLKAKKDATNTYKSQNI